MASHQASLWNRGERELGNHLNRYSSLSHTHTQTHTHTHTHTYTRTHAHARTQTRATLNSRLLGSPAYERYPNVTQEQLWTNQMGTTRALIWQLVTNKNQVGLHFPTFDRENHIVTSWSRRMSTKVGLTKQFFTSLGSESELREDSDISVVRNFLPKYDLFYNDFSWDCSVDLCAIEPELRVLDWVSYLYNHKNKNRAVYKDIFISYLRRCAPVFPSLPWLDIHQ